MLDQHLAHVGLVQPRVDGLLRVFQEALAGLAEGGVVSLLARDHVAQRGQHGRQVGLELLHGTAKAGDLGPLVAEKQLQQLFQLRHVGHAATHHLLTALDQHGLRAVLEEDVVLRVAALELEGDLGVQVVGLVLGFPVAEGHAQHVQQGAVDIAAFAGLGVEFVLGHKLQVLLAAPGFEQVLERLAHHRFTQAAADFLDPVELGQVLVDQNLAHLALPVGYPAMIST